jgi:SAM-dependent methyltransferase
MNESIRREEEFHGAHWNAAHGGYFSDAAVAAPLAASAAKWAAATGAGVVVDLGGGTGFLLGRLAAAGLGAGVRRVVLDDSERQLASARAAGLDCVRGSVGTFARAEVAGEGERALFLMRSVLHYAGEAGLPGLLRHVGRQMRSGECFVHQTAAFRREEDAEAMNELYRLMRTEKWYPTIGALGEWLEAEGWRIEETQPAAPLRLESGELAERYQLDGGDLRRMREAMARRDGVGAEVFSAAGEGFVAHLHYHTWVCRWAGGAEG